MPAVGHQGPAQPVPLSALDADLAARLGPGLADHRVPAWREAPGPWTGVPPDAGLGVLVARGMLAHRTRVGRHASMVLAWAGDVVTPSGPVPDFIMGNVGWQVLEPAVLARLDAGFLHAACEHPEALAAVVERVSALHARSLTAVALSQLPRVEDRLLGILLMLAEERGRMTADGLVVDAFLTHERLGELIGAARPTVSLAFARLRQRELVFAHGGAWVIRSEAASTLTGPAVPGRPASEPLSADAL